LASTVNVPLLGAQNKGTVVGVSLAGLGVTAFLIYRYQKKTAAQTAAATSAANATAAAAASGYGYGTNGVYPNGYYGYGEPQYSYGYGASGGFEAGYYGYGTPEAPVAPVTTNAQWTQAAITQLSGQGYQARSIAGALGAYITGKEVDATQERIIDAAIGVEGYPPQAGPNNYPPSIKTKPPKGQKGKKAVTG
jgi:hypothetical protein